MDGVYRKKSTEDTYDTSEGALPFHLQRIAEDNLGENATRRKESLQRLAKLLSEEPDLNSRMDTEFLLRFLRGRKYNVEAALQTIRNYYYNRCACAGVYRGFLPSKVPPEARKLVMVMPGKDIHGRPVIILNIGAWSPKKISHAAFHKAAMMCAEHITSDPAAQTLGVTLIVDYHKFAVENVLSLKPGIIRAEVEYIQNCMPSRMKAIHVVRERHAFGIFNTIAKPFMSSKLAGRVSEAAEFYFLGKCGVRSALSRRPKYRRILQVHFHGEKLESLHKEISPENLPADLGGEAPPLDYDGFWNEMDKLEDRFGAENCYGYSNQYLGDFATKEEIEKDLEFL